MDEDPDDQPAKEEADEVDHVEAISASMPMETIGAPVSPDHLFHQVPYPSMLTDAHPSLSHPFHHFPPPSTPILWLNTLDKKKAQEQAKPAVNNPGNTLAIAAPPAAATATANIATTSSATIEELPPTPISGSPLTSTTHFANENSLFDFLGEHGADYDINTMEMDHFDANI
ncbi:hypothetical protein EW145_g6395, partial [Phellinidium pouzarii]